MSRHPFDALSLVLGIVMTAIGVAGLVVSTGGLGLPDLDWRFVGPTLLIGAAVVTIGVTLRRAVR